MEKLFHYVWKHKMFPLGNLATTTGEAVEVIDTGLHNSDAGPDFFNAKIKIGGRLWAGNVELHLRSSNWKQHGHNQDKAYDNVILHVVTDADCEVFTSQNESVPQLVLPIPDSVKTNYEHLLHEDRYPRCHKLIPQLPKLTVNSWLSALHTERLERKTKDILERLKACDGSWEDAFFQTLARNFGFGINADAFEMWAKSLPLHCVDHHRDDLFQIEAMFLGQAGLLSLRDKMQEDEYWQRLNDEYKYLAHKFNLKAMDGRMWRFMRLRPQNFPTVRLSQLAQLYFNRTAGLSQLLNCKDAKELEKALATHATPYWQTHYNFGEESRKNEKRLSKSSILVLLVNTVIPLLFAYGRSNGNESLVNRAVDMMEQLGAEDNNIVRMWRECGLAVDSAADSQALIQLKKEYCDRKECLRCRIGYRYLSLPPTPPKEGS